MAENIKIRKVLLEAQTLLKQAYDRLLQERHAGWCKVFPANRCGNNSYTYGKEEEKFCDCGYAKWRPGVEKLLGLPETNIWD